MPSSNVSATLRGGSVRFVQPADRLVERQHVVAAVAQHAKPRLQHGGAHRVRPRPLVLVVDRDAVVAQDQQSALTPLAVPDVRSGVPVATTRPARAASRRTVIGGAGIGAPFVAARDVALGRPERPRSRIRRLGRRHACHTSQRPRAPFAVARTVATWIRMLDTTALRSMRNGFERSCSSAANAADAGQRATPRRRAVRASPPPTRRTRAPSTA